MVTGVGAAASEASERTPLAVSAPEKGDSVGDVGSKVDDVVEIGDGDVDRLGDGVVRGSTEPISSKKWPCVTSCPSSSMKKHDVSSTPVSITWWYTRNRLYQFDFVFRVCRAHVHAFRVSQD